MATAATAQPSKLGGGVIKTAIRTLAGFAGLGILLYAPIGGAYAQAPIFFASPNNADHANDHRYQQLASAPAKTASLTKGSNRVEYRYPDQPDMVFGAYGPRKVTSADAPMAFSSSDAAIDVAAARRISGTSDNDPALTPGAFDARKAARENAARVTANRYAAATNMNFTQKAGYAKPSGTAKQKVGAPYQIKGRWYVPAVEPDYDEVGIGSWYGAQFHGRKTATGEIFDMQQMTAAHTTLPIPSLARVTNLENGRTIVVRINDRGPFIDNRIIDLSQKAADVIGYQENGKAKVRVQYLGPAPAEHNSLPTKYVAENQRAAQLSVRNAQASLRPISAPLKQPKGYGDYQLQAGSFSELGNAHVLRAKLDGLAPVSVKEVKVKGREYFRVLLGPWPSRPAAEDAKQRLMRSGFDTIIVAAK